MKAYIDTKETESMAITRVVKALAKYAPKNINFVDNPTQADLVVINVVGRLEHLKMRIKNFGKPYAMVQYILRGSLNPNTKDWIELWKNARVVYSYYDLKKLCKDDSTDQNFNFYHAPLGVESEVFHPTKRGHKYLICTSGLLYTTESVRECILAAKGRKVMHLGPELHKPNTDCYHGISDETLANLYNQCDFVSGLRRTQGFELPAAEGLLCGTKPILFDQPHYRQWYDGLAHFIPENSRDEVIQNLKKIFNNEQKSVIRSDIEEAKKRFDWHRIIPGFWNMAL